MGVAKVLDCRLPICDTNIIINFFLGDILDRYVELRDGIHISDVVNEELKRLFKESTNYKDLSEICDKHTGINIIRREEFFDEEVQAVINFNLNEFGLRNNSFLKGELCEDMGEFVNALYAINLGVKWFISNDKKFIREYENEPAFENLEMRNMEQTLDCMIGKDKRKLKISEIKSKNYNMKQEIDEEKEEKKLLKLIEKWKLQS